MIQIRTRIDQIDQLTRGISLPLSPIPEMHLRVIASVISEEWAGLTSELGSALASLEEAEINAHMESRLNHAVARAGPFGQLVSAVARGKETTSFDGRHLEKRPDLSLFLTRSHPAFPLVAECKIIDAPAKGVSLYCDKGISRFVQGEYAWASREGMVLAYVKDGSTITATLVPHLAESQRSLPDPYETVTPSRTGAATLDVSTHGRSFRYVGLAGASPPGPLELWHVWLT